MPTWKRRSLQAWKPAAGEPDPIYCVRSLDTRRSTLWLYLSIALTLSSCSVPSFSASNSDAGHATFATTTTTGPFSTTTSNHSEASTTTTVPELPRALVTNTGVVVRVVGDTPTGFVVMDPCGDTTRISGGVDVGKVDVVVDPGHGGPRDTGTVGPNGLVEADLNLTVAEALANELERRQIPTVLTRTGPYATTLLARSGLADHVGAKLLISIHHNAPSPGGSSGPGTEVFTQFGNPGSQRLGTLIWEEVTDRLATTSVDHWVAAKDAGALSVLNSRGVDAYGMLRHPETTSVLAELAYLSNRPEAELLASDQYPPLVAEAVANAIEHFLTSDRVGDAPQPPNRIFHPQPSPSTGSCVAPVLE